MSDGFGQILESLPYSSERYFSTQYCELAEFDSMALEFWNVLCYHFI